MAATVCHIRKRTLHSLKKKSFFCQVAGYINESNCEETKKNSLIFYNCRTIYTFIW